MHSLRGVGGYLEGSFIVSVNEGYVAGIALNDRKV